MRIAIRIPWRSAHTIVSSRGPGDQHRGRGPGQIQGVRNRRPGDKRPDVHVVLLDDSHDDPDAFVILTAPVLASGLPAPRRKELGIKLRFFHVMYAGIESFHFNGKWISWSTNGDFSTF